MSVLSAARPLAPGLAVAAIIGVGALVLGPALPGVGGITLALLGGMAVALSRVCGPRTAPGAQVAGAQVLELAIVLLALKLDVAAIGAMGWRAVLVVGGAVLATLACGLLAARLLGIPRSLGCLLGIGTAICGASAIAAAAPVVSRERDEIALSVGVVNLLGTGGLLALPLVISVLGLSDGTAGLLVGGSLQSVGHVVAAGFAVGDTVGELATAVKMGRVALLAPLVLLIGLVTRRGGGARVPPYLLAFLALALLEALGLVPASVVRVAGPVGEGLLAVGMAGLGLQLSAEGVLSRGPRALLAGALIFALQLCVLASLLALSA